MIKRFTNYFFVIAAVAGTIFLAYRFFGKISNQEKALIEVVPESAAIIVEIHQPFPLWNKLNGSNIIWDDLRIQPYFKQISQVAQRIDSSSRQIPEFGQLVYNKPLLFSIHVSGINSDHLFAFHQGNSSKESIKNHFEAIFNKSQLTEEKIFKNHTFYLLNNSGYYLLIEEGIITLCSSLQLCESVALQIETKKSIKHSAGFTEIKSTISQQADASIIINHQHLPTLLSGWLSKENNQHLLATKPYALFSGLDINFSSSTISLNGFSVSSDSITCLLDIFSSHTTQEFTSSSILPENTSGFIWLGINDGSQFIQSIENYHTRRGTINTYREKINQFNAEFDCNLNQQIISWVGNELVLFTTSNSSSINLQEHLLLAIKVNDLNNPTEELNLLGNKLNQDGEKLAIDLFGGIEIRRLNHESIFEILFGSLFSGIKEPYYMRINDYIVFANSAQSIENYLKDLANDKILGKNITYFNFVSENLNSKSNITVYANPSLISSQYKSFLNPEQNINYSFTENLLSRFNAFAWQMSRNDKLMFYNNIYLKYNSTGKQDSKSLWELALDTTVSNKVFIIQNHITNTGDVLVQDDNYQLYLVSSKGTISWKKQLDEKIVGEIRQIDFFGNGKLQLVFCTSSQVHLLDLKGNYLDNFPFNLKGEVKSNFSIFDYENNNNYRFLIPIDQKIINLGKDGKLTEGWAFEGSSAPIMQAPVFFRSDNKDYIFVCDQEGEMYVLDRKGKIRYQVNTKLDKRTSNTVLLQSSTKIEYTKITYSDSLGNIIHYYFNGNSDTARIQKLSPSHIFAIVDLNKDNEDDLIILDSNKVKIRQWNGKSIGEYQFSENIKPSIYLHKAKDGSYKIGFLSVSAGELYVLNQDGSMHPKFPLNGNTGFMIRDINGDGTLEIISGIAGRRIICYSFN